METHKLLYGLLAILIVLGGLVAYYSTQTTGQKSLTYQIVLSDKETSEYTTTTTTLPSQICEPIVFSGESGYLEVAVVEVLGNEITEVIQNNPDCSDFKVKKIFKSGTEISLGSFIALETVQLGIIEEGIFKIHGNFRFEPGDYPDDYASMYFFNNGKQQLFLKLENNCGQVIYPNIRTINPCSTSCFDYQEGIDNCSFPSPPTYCDRIDTNEKLLLSEYDRIECEGDYLVERSCSIQGIEGSVETTIKKICPYGCEYASCVTTSNPCTDSDGNNYFNKGWVAGQYPNSTHYNHSDYCDGYAVQEHYCIDSDTWAKGPNHCLNGCSDGACI